MADSIFGGSEVIKNPVGPIEPIPLQYLNEGFASEEQNTKNSLADIQSKVNFLNMTPASAGDAKVFEQAKQAMMDRLQNVDISNLSTPQNKGQINDIISSVTNNPAVMASAQRSATVASMKREKDIAESKGQNYYNTGWDDYLDYNKQGLFIQNKQFTSDGAIAPDYDKDSKSVLDGVTQTVKRIQHPDGTIEEINSKSPEDIAAAWQERFDNDPKYQKLHQYQFARATKDVNWGVDGENYRTNFENEAQQSLAMQKRLLGTLNPNTREYMEAQARADNAQKTIGELQAIKGSGNIGNSLKQQQFQEYQRNEALKLGLSHDYVQQGDIKYNQIKMEQIKAGYEMQKMYNEKLYQAQLNNGDINETTGHLNIGGEGNIPSKSETKDFGNGVMLPYQDIVNGLNSHDPEKIKGMAESLVATKPSAFGLTGYMKQFPYDIESDGNNVYIIPKMSYTDKDGNRVSGQDADRNSPNTIKKSIGEFEAISGELDPKLRQGSAIYHKKELNTPIPYPTDQNLYFPSITSGMNNITNSPQLKEGQTYSDIPQGIVPNYKQINGKLIPMPTTREELDKIPAGTDIFINGKVIPRPKK